MSSKVSIREFSRMVGVSDTAVRKAIASGKIVNSIDYTNPIRPKIDAEQAVIEWGRNHDPSSGQLEKIELKKPEVKKPEVKITEPKKVIEKKIVVKKEAPKKTPQTKKTVVVKKTEPVPPVVNHVPPPPPPPQPIYVDANSIAEIKRQTAKVKLASEALDLKKKQGSLVDKDKVYKILFNAGKDVKSAIQAIPDRFIDEILAQKTRNEAHKVLSDAIADTLEVLIEIQTRDIS